MKELEQDTREYFAGHPKSYWHWLEDGSVAVWSDGITIAFREELLAVIERLKAAGMTIIIVEQSLNVALAVADRAVFLEKGEVRFSGPAAELAGRDDLARAVFLGTEGG